MAESPAGLVETVRTLAFGAREGEDAPGLADGAEASLPMPPDRTLTVIRNGVSGAVMVSVCGGPPATRDETEKAREALLRLTYDTRFSDPLIGSLDPEGGETLTLAVEQPAIDVAWLTRALEDLVRRYDHRAAADGATNNGSDSRNEPEVPAHWIPI
jgi:hypothetical protein